VCSVLNTGVRELRSLVFSAIIISIWKWIDRMLCNLVLIIREIEKKKHLAFARDRRSGIEMAPIYPKKRMMEKLFLTWSVWLAVTLSRYSALVCLTFAEERMRATSLEDTVPGRYFASFPSNYFLFNLEVIINNIKHSVLTLRSYSAKTKRSVLFMEIIVVCCENHIKHSNSLCGQNAEILKCWPDSRWYIYVVVTI